MIMCCARLRGCSGAFGQAVEAEWLAELGPMFFSVKESYKTRLEKRVREREDKAKMEVEMKEAEDR